jgi:tight adherence protein B
MLLPLVVFAFFVALVMGTYVAIVHLPRLLAERELRQRLQEVAPASEVTPVGAPALVREEARGPVPLNKMIDRAGVKSTPSRIFMASATLGAAAAFAAMMITTQFAGWVVATVLGLVSPIVWLKYRASKRMARFEEQFPEALDLLSRAIRAGHAFQTAMGMVADEMPDPVGPEFKKAFDQQNFGLPLKDALNQLAERVTVLDVRFFITAVTIQRETGGNLAEILDNLAHVVRERFKILRQVRVHTAHGRFTGYVLLALPAALAVALSYINPEFMSPLFHERMGQTMLIGGLVLQTIGFFWIRQVIKIEV